MIKECDIDDETAEIVIGSLENTLEIFEQCIVDYKDWNKTKKDGFHKFNQQECDNIIEYYEKRVNKLKTVLETLKASEHEEQDSECIENEKDVEVFYIPLLLHPHNFGANQGTYHLEVFLTLEELRRYHPEPMKYFRFINTTKP